MGYVNLYLDEHLHKKIKHLATDQKKSQRKLIGELLEKGLEYYE